ncbi:hypothetical protein [Rhodococcus sp. ARP2]|uniref:hypothetical protein n=1 Tax=Rhodococcus sp. ARP2 TaxID=1661385 RepID=UPI0011874420|nr:hypothetical protein [Rhodococcus sp. ARP2]
MTITRARLDRMSSGSVAGKSAETALPIRLDKFDRRPTAKPLDNLTNEVVTWARVVAEQCGQEKDLYGALSGIGLRQLVHNNRQRRRDPASLSVEGALDVELAALWLADCAGYLAWLPAIAEMHDAITDVIAHCRRVIDRQPQLTYKGPCPQVCYDEERQPFTCSADLYVERGEDYVSCPRCWTHHRVRELELTMMRAVNDQLFTIAEIERLLRELGEPIPLGTLYSWHSRKALEPRAWRQADGTNTKFWMRRSDPPLFRLGDARVLHANPASANRVNPRDGRDCDESGNYDGT